MRDFQPHITVATVVFDGSRYLMVYEKDKTSGAMVYNQPAGHLEANESLQQAALRECHEETGWEVALTGILGTALYLAPGNGVTYYRTTFMASPLQCDAQATLDPDISAAQWMSYEQIKAVSDKLRSPLVLASIERHRAGLCFPLDLIYST